MVLESELFLSGGLKLHTCQTPPIAIDAESHREEGREFQLFAEGGKPFLGIPWKELWATEGPRPNLLGCCSVSLSPPPLFSFFFFFPFLFGSSPASPAIAAFWRTKSRFFPCEVTLLCVF